MYLYVSLCKIHFTQVHIFFYQQKKYRNDIFSAYTHHLKSGGHLDFFLLGSIANFKGYHLSNFDAFTIN